MSGKTPQVEKDAILLDRIAVLYVVGALRRYRQAVAGLLADRYQDGEVDRVRLAQFESECAGIEEGCRDD